MVFCVLNLFSLLLSLVNSNCNGCSGKYGNGQCDTYDQGNSGYTLMNNKVYACRGLISGGIGTPNDKGMNDPNLDSICSSEYEVCQGLHTLNGWGFKWTMCDNIKYNSEFYAAKVTSDGAADCHWNYPTSGTDDIWGCAKNNNNNPVYICTNDNDCRNGNAGGNGNGCGGVLNARLHQIHGTQPTYPQSWSNDKWGADGTSTEFITVGLGEIKYGGVLCCIKPTSSPTKSPTSKPTKQTKIPTLLTVNPTTQPSIPPTLKPTNNPTFTRNPTNIPTIPTAIPSGAPTMVTIEPTLSTNQPTQVTDVPTKNTIQPTGISGSPTLPTLVPTKFSLIPTVNTINPTNYPTSYPTQIPSIMTTIQAGESKIIRTEILIIIVLVGFLVCSILILIFLALKCNKKHKKNKAKIKEQKIQMEQISSMESTNKDNLKPRKSEGNESNIQETLKNKTTKLQSENSSNSNSQVEGDHDKTTNGFEKKNIKVYEIKNKNIIDDESDDEEMYRKSVATTKDENETQGGSDIVEEQVELAMDIQENGNNISKGDV